MTEFDLILTGSEGFLGQNVKEHLLKQNLKLACLDLKLGHDFRDEDFVKNWFKNNSAPVIVNAFGLNDKISNLSLESNFDFELKQMKEFFEINVMALYSICREYIRNRKTGRIINFSSIYSKVSPRRDIYLNYAKNPAYGMSKAAVNQLGRHLSVYFAPEFTVNTLILGGFLENQDDDFVRRYEKNVPLNRMGSPKDLFSIIDFLAFAKTDYLTGSEITIDGGWTAL
jgi:NAD(P)-dependent dehydrogenase (short-subunit alcohol dehydrogenase family)